MPAGRLSYTVVGAGKGTLAGIVGWVLRHRKGLLVAYFALLHILIYQLVYSSGGTTSAPEAVSSQDALRLNLQVSTHPGVFGQLCLGHW